MEISKNIEKILSRGFLQTLAILIYVNIFIMLPFICVILTPILVVYLNNIGRLIFLLYIAFIYLDNSKHFFANSNGVMLLRQNFMTNLLRDYFPIKLIKTAKLKPNRNYIFASFPHGIACIGICNNMGNNIGTFLKLFPGIRPKIATLNTSFYTPFCREIFGSLGIVSCSKESLTYYLSKSNDPKHEDNRDGFTSNAVAILVGGIKELFDSKPGNYMLTLNNRKGFIKMAIKTGSSIVPTFSFGEVDIYDEAINFPNFFLRNFQLLASACNVFKYSLGYRAKRKPIVQVVGAPIEVMKMLDPSPLYIDEIHQKLIFSINEIFDKYKHKYLENADEIKLIIN